MPTPTAGATPLVSKAALWTLSIAAGVIGLVTALYCLILTSWSVADPTTGDFTFRVTATLPGDMHEMLNTSIGSDTVLTYLDGGTLISASEPLLAPRILTGIATALPFLIALAGCVGVILIARKLGRQQPFTGALRWVLGALGALAAVSAVCVPWFEALTTQLAVAQLGLPSDGEAVGDGGVWVNPQYFSWEQDLNWSLLLLGAVLILVAVLLGKATRMQRDTEGLV